MAVRSAHQAYKHVFRSNCFHDAEADTWPTSLKIL